MAINDGHFKAPVNIRTTAEPSEFPIELLYVAGGLLVLAVIGGAIYWRRLAQQDAMADG